MIIDGKSGPVLILDKKIRNVVLIKVSRGWGPSKEQNIFHTGILGCGVYFTFI